MNSWIACALAEHAKLKRTLARGLSFAVPLCALLLSLFVLGNLESVAAAKDLPLWQTYLDSLLRIWASFLLPFMVTLQAVLLAQLEHANRQWKYLLALPVPRASLYIAKTVNLFALVVLAHVLLWLMAMVTCVMAGMAEGSFSEITSFLTRHLAATCAATLVLAAVQLLVAIVIESFVAAISIGLLATLVALLGANTMGSAADYFPWSMPLRALGQPTTVWMLAVLLAAAGVSWLGTLTLQRMQVR